ncbi:MAG: spore germination protein [Solirubrobacterales bacterium]
MAKKRRIAVPLRIVMMKSLFRRIKTESRHPPIESCIDGVCPDLSANRQVILKSFGGSADLNLRQLHLGGSPGISMLVTYIDGLVNGQLVSESVMKPIVTVGERLHERSHSAEQVYDHLKNHLLTGSQVKEISRMTDLLQLVCAGNCAILIDGVASALACDTRGWNERSIEESKTEPAIRGIREGFVETLRTNISMIRRRVKDPRLRIEELSIGKISHTTVIITYIQGLASERTAQEARTRISRVVTDFILESGNIEEYIEDAPLSPFPTVLRTDRPDRVIGSLYEGRIAILIDGTPFALIVPCSLPMFLTAADDYNERSLIGSFLRALRYLLFVVSLTLPAFFVALITFHHEMLPTPLLLAIAAQREGVPFPALLEALIMEIAFEILREASVRVPAFFGPAVSILGVLILGQIAVSAGLVSPFMVIIIALTAISSLSIPIYSMGMTIRLLRFLILVMSGSLGLLGFLSSIAAILIHLMTLRSFGLPYFTPFGPLIVPELKDSIIRAPWWSLRARPELLGGNDAVRQPAGQMPAPPGSGTVNRPKREGNA